MKLQLFPKTRKGANRIAEHGETWEFVRCEMRPAFAQGKPGPFFLIRSERTNAERWIHGAGQDADFDVQ